MRPEISIVVPTKDRPELVGELVASLRAQTLAGWEAVVVDDGSTPAALEALRAAAADARVRIVVARDGPPGANRCRNVGLRAAECELVVFFDDDDLLSPTCLAARVAAMRERPDADLAVFPYRRFRRVPGDLPGAAGPRRSPEPLDAFLRLEPPWHTGSAVWRRSFLARVGPWDERLTSWQDWELGIRALTLAPRLVDRDGPEFHVRVASATHRNVSGAGWNVRHVRSWALGVEAVADRLEATALLDPRRRALLAVLYLFVAERLVEVGDAAAARALWSRGLDRRLVPPAVAPAARLLLAAARLRAARPAVQAVLARAMPSRRLTAALEALLG